MHIIPERLTRNQLARTIVQALYGMAEEPDAASLAVRKMERASKPVLLRRYALATSILAKAAA